MKQIAHKQFKQHELYHKIALKVFLTYRNKVYGERFSLLNLIKNKNRAITFLKCANDQQW